MESDPRKVAEMFEEIAAAGDVAAVQTERVSVAVRAHLICDSIAQGTAVVAMICAKTRRAVPPPVAGETALGWDISDTGIITRPHRIEIIREIRWPIAYLSPEKGKEDIGRRRADETTPRRAVGRGDQRG